MKYFKVLVISISGAGKSIHKHGDIVCENELSPNSAETLVKGKYIKECAAPKGVKEESVEYDGPSLEELQKKYLDLSGSDFIPGNWGIPKLTKQIHALTQEHLDVLREHYDEYGGLETEEERKDWDSDRYNLEIDAFKNTSE